MFGTNRRLGEDTEEYERRVKRETERALDDARYEADRQREDADNEHRRILNAGRAEFQGLQNDYEILASDKAEVEMHLENARADFAAALTIAKQHGFAGNDDTCEQLVRNILAALVAERGLHKTEIEKLKAKSENLPDGT